VKRPNIVFYNYNIKKKASKRVNDIQKSDKLLTERIELASDKVSSCEAGRNRD
jgi:hypothetical protein